MRLMMTELKVKFEIIFPSKKIPLSLYHRISERNHHACVSISLVRMRSNDLSDFRLSGWPDDVVMIVERKNNKFERGVADGDDVKFK
jgi:hypothetical protein